MKDATIVGVAALVEHIKNRLSSDETLRNVRVRGEVTNYKPGPDGALFFELREGTTILKCVSWSDTTPRLPEFGNGSAVVVSGFIGVFPKRSLYSLTVRFVELDGLGDHHKQFEELKKRLAAEGLFDASRKRKLPALPFRVALVSSRRAAGAQDFEDLLRASRPHIEILRLDATVQGSHAPVQIAGAIGRASRVDVDLIVVTRGGGSAQDLVSFNDERVIRAIVAARHPVISAVGHAIDRQLSDYAADRYAETPSAAVEMMGPRTRDLRERIRERMLRARALVTNLRERRRERLERIVVRSRLDAVDVLLAPQRASLHSSATALDDAALRMLRLRGDNLGVLSKRLEALDPTRRLQDRERSFRDVTHRLELASRLRMQRTAQALEQRTARLAPATRVRLGRLHQRAELLQARLAANDPEAILQRGYAIVTRTDGTIVRDPAGVELGEVVSARLARGTLSARVEAKELDGDD